VSSFVLLWPDELAVVLLWPDELAFEILQKLSLLCATVMLPASACLLEMQCNLAAEPGKLSQSFDFCHLPPVWGMEPVVTHQTSWLESTGVCDIPTCTSKIDTN